MAQKTFIRIYTDDSMPEICRCRKIPVILDEYLNLVEPVNRWILALAKKGLTESTIRAYSDAILDFLRTLGASEEQWHIQTWEDVREIHLKSYYISTERKSSRQTANQFTLRVMFFYRWALGRGYIHALPWTSVLRSIKEYSGSPEGHEKFKPIRSDSIRAPTQSTEVFVYTNEQLKAITSNLSYRDKLIAKWALLCGLRAFEIANMTVMCIRSARVGALVEVTLPRTKSGMPQPIVVPKSLWGQTLRYIEFERAALLTNQSAILKNKSANSETHDALFINRFGKPIQATRISKNWLKARRKANMTKGVFHDLRHTFADNLYMDLLTEQQRDPGLNVDKALQSAVRHESILTTYKFYISHRHKERLLVERAIDRRAEQLGWDYNAEA